MTVVTPHCLLNQECIFLPPVDEVEGVSKFLNDATAQWKNLALEVRSVRSMLEEVISNWEKYTSSVAALQAWLEDAERMLSQSENAKRVSTSQAGTTSVAAHSPTRIRAKIP